MPGNADTEEQETSDEQKLAGECPICEGDLVATPDSKTVKCKECGYEEPTYAR